MPYEWQRVGDDEKIALLDSAKHFLDSLNLRQAGVGIVETTVPVTDLPDYRPPMRLNSARLAPDGRIWVNTTLKRPDLRGPVFDVINRSGVLVDRVVIVPARAVLGFAANGTIYLTWRDGLGSHLARARQK